MKKIIISLLRVIMVVYIVFGLLLYIKQETLLYHPTKEYSNNFSYEEKIFKSDNELIKTTILNSRRDKAIIYFGGNAEDVDSNANKFKKIFKDYTIYLVKYRGYSGSTGKPSQKALFADALNIYDSIKKRYKNISVIGRSLGSGIAIFLASKRDIYKLALITPYDSILSIAQDMFPIYPMSILLKDKYKSIDRVDKLKTKTLILIAQHDQVVTKIHSDNLINKFPKSKIIVKVIKNEDHNTISLNPNYYKLLKEFFTKD